MTHCQIIQTERLNEAQRAERALFDVLARLPAGYFLYRELKTTPAYREQVSGSMQAKPDMVVVGANVGVLAFEVKDWNIRTNVYEWLNQYKIRVRRANGTVDTISNPSDQAERYQHALRALLRDVDVFVQCFVAFPRLTRQEFLNKFKDLTVLSNPQSRFFLDMGRTLFKDDLAQSPRHPEDVLVKLAKRHAKFRPSEAAEITRANQILVPATFCIGNALVRQKEREELLLLSEEQQKWVFSTDERHNYLLDLAGSGKTNILISKALHLVARSGDAAPPTILLTTYSTNLETNIRRIFEGKIEAAEGNAPKFRNAITVMGIPALTKAIVKAGADGELSEPDNGESAEAYESRLRDWAADILEEDSGKFARFDYVLIDEIQDFDDTHLYIVTKVCRGGKYLFVGDIGQKIYERSHDLQRHGIITEPLALDRSFRMYRTPKHIAELALEFVQEDPYVQNDFIAHGYGTAQCVNTSEAVAVLESTNAAGASIAETTGDLLARDHVEADILIIASQKGSEEIITALQSANIRFSRGETAECDAVTVVDFMSAKGLERPTVIIAGIEDLFCRAAAAFDDEELCARKESLARRQLYVALTRTTEDLFVYYSSTNAHPFIQELLDVNARLVKRVQRKARHAR